MDLVIEETEEITGSVTPSPSKFETQFATAIGALADGETIIKSPLIVDDTRDFAKGVEDLGRTTKRTKSKWKVWGEGTEFIPETQAVDAKKSIIGLSLLSSLSSLASRLMVNNCKRQLRELPVPSLLDNLQKIGVDIHSSNQDEKPPLITFDCKLEGGEISLDAKGDPRFLPAFLLLSPLAEDGVKLDSYPGKNSLYLKKSLEFMKKAGIEISQEEDILRIPEGDYEPIEIEPSLNIFSTFPYVTGALLTRSELEIKKADKALNLDDFENLLKDLGIEFTKEESKITIEPDQKIKTSEINLKSTPAMLPYIAVLATDAEGETIIKGAEKARKMKSDRIEGITEGLSELGAKIEETNDGLKVKNSTNLEGALVDGRYDPVLVAALGVAGLISEERTQVMHRAESLRQSYPQFVTTFKDLGAKMSYST